MRSGPPIPRVWGLFLLCASLVIGLPEPANAADIKSLLGPARLDLSFTIGAESSDNFVRRRGLGARVRLMPIKIAGIDVMFVGMPNLGETDYTALTRQFKDGSEVIPDISRALAAFQISAILAPLHGKLKGPKGKTAIEFDWYFTIGAGFVATEDDVALIEMPECSGEAYIENIDTDMCGAVRQAHPAWSMGMGLRSIFGGKLVIGLELRAMEYTEQVFREGDSPVDPETREPILDPLTGEPKIYHDSDKKMLWWSLSIGGSFPMRKR
jgi:hypothetical protein